jgi:hypothetical protein
MITLITSHAGTSYATIPVPPPFGTSAFPKQYLFITSHVLLYPRPMSIVHARGSLWCEVLVGEFWWVWLTLCDGIKSDQDCRDQSPDILDAVHAPWILPPNHSFISSKRECILTQLQRSVSLSYYSCSLQSPEVRTFFLA